MSTSVNRWEGEGPERWHGVWEINISSEDITMKVFIVEMSQYCEKRQILLSEFVYLFIFKPCFT